MNKKIISEGAEAKIFSAGNRIKKERIAKSYRHPILDEQIRKQRTKREGKLLYKAHQQNISVPQIFNVNTKGEPDEKYVLDIEYIDGERLSETLNSYTLPQQKKIMKSIGTQVALLHTNDIIHGDLTTSNIMLKKDIIYIIDFGLGYISKKIEDKAVDLHVIKQALEAKHFTQWETLFTALCTTYTCNEAPKILKRLEEVERRGRYKRAS